MNHLHLEKSPQFLGYTIYFLQKRNKSLKADFRDENLEISGAVVADSINEAVTVSLEVSKLHYVKNKNFKYQLMYLALRLTSQFGSANQ